MTSRFRVLGVLADVFKGVAAVQVVAAVVIAGAGVGAGMAFRLVAAVLGAGALSALFTFSIGSLIDLARSCEAHLAVMADEARSSGWVKPSAS